MSKREENQPDVFAVVIVVIIVVLLAMIAAPPLVKLIVDDKKANCEETVVEECGDAPEGYKLQRRGNEWRVASTKIDWQSMRTYGSRKEAVEMAQYLAGWKDEECEWVDVPATKPTGGKEYKYEIYSNGKCYFWYDNGCGISARRFNSCAEAICGVEAYFRMLQDGDADGTKRVLTGGMNWPHNTQYRGYYKVKSGVFKCEPAAKPSDDCGCD